MTEDLDQLVRDAHERMLADHEDAAQALALELGVSYFALEALDLGWTLDAYWCVPMRDADRQVVNVQRRSVRPRAEVGQRKFRVLPDRRNGLFIPKGPILSPVFVPEGASDTAALLTRRLQAVGRSSATPKDDELHDLAKLLKGRGVVVVGDRDQSGIDGAHHTANVLTECGLSCKLLIPQRFKDVRVAFNEGLRGRQLLELAEHTPPHSP